MTTYASVYINGEVLCYTSLDGYPFNLGESLERVNSNWRSVLLTCKDYGICTVNIKYFNKDPEFVYNCLGKYAKRNFINIVPNGLTPSAIEILRKGDPHEKFENIIRNFPNELYEAPEHMLSNIIYHYNLMNNQVIVRYPIKNFPWIPVEEALEIEGGELEEISNDMYGFLGDEDIDYRYETYRKVEENGPISSGRHLLKGCKKATELLSQDPNSWWNYGVSLELAGNLNQAIESYKQATRLTPNNPKIWQILGSAYLRNNYKEEAHKSFENAISNIKNLDYSIMDYNEKEKFKNNTTNLYKTLLKADFEDLINTFNENIHSKISLKEIEFLTSVQEKIGKPFLNYESERGKIIKLSLGYLKLETISDSLGYLTSLKELNLEKNNLKSLPESIGLLTLLEELDLSMNWLTNLPEGIGKLSSLKKLNLKKNKLKTHPAWLTKLPLLEHLEIDPVIPEIDPKEKEVIELIEKEIEKPLPIVLEINKRELGYIVKNKHITGLSLYNCKLTSIPESIGSLTSLKMLNLSPNKLTSIPESIGSLTSLKMLNLSSNKLTSIPDWIGNLVSLEELGLHDNELIKLPESIGLLTSLKILDLGSNKLSSLPKSIANLVLLESLSMRYNDFESLPEEVYSLTSLKELDIGGKEGLIPSKSLRNLKSLEILCLSSSKLKKVPESVRFLTSLKKLDLNYNNISDLPEWISSLILLEELNIINQYGDLPSIPESIKALNSLKKLNVSINRLTILPEWIGSLKSLEELDLHRNNLAMLPESFGSLTSLKKLDLSDNKLAMLPESFGSLTSLNKLDLRINRLILIPESINSLSSLIYLNFLRNELESIPDWIGTLTALEGLNLASNKLNSLPESISSLTSLKELDLRNNDLSTLPKSISSLVSLEKLDLSANKLTSLSESISSLTSLKELDLRDNNLSTLPDSLKELEKKGIEINTDF